MSPIRLGLKGDVLQGAAGVVRARPDADAASDVALVCEGGQAVGRGLVQREPGSTSETDSGMPSGADRNCTLPPNALCS